MFLKWSFSEPLLYSETFALSEDLVSLNRFVQWSKQNNNFLKSHFKGQGMNIFFIKEEIYRGHRLLWFMAELSGVCYGLDWHEAIET